MANYVKDIVLFKEPDDSSYLGALPVVNFLKRNRQITLKRPVTIFVGENGTGKSTLLEAIAVSFGFNAEGGSRNFNFHTRKTHSELCDCIRLGKNGSPKDGYFLRAESFYNVATNIDVMDEHPTHLAPPVINSYGGTSLHEMSHGESFFALIHNRFSGNGFYILDEPEAALSPMRLMALLVEIDRLVKNNSQFIISTHSPILMTYPGAEILELSENGIESVNYKDTEHYRVTKDFLENPERMYRYLLDE